MSSPLALAVAAWFARSRAAFEVSVPVVWYRRFLVKYVDWCNSVFVLRWLVRIAKFGLVIAAVGLAWNVDLRSVLRVPVPDAWQYGYLVALVVVLAVMFVVAVPGFILIRAVRAVLLAVGVALVPVAFLVVYMWSFHAIDIRTVRAAQFLSNGWESGHALPWSLAFVVVAVHAGWAGLAGWLLWHPERAVAVVHAVVVVPLWIVARLAVPIVVTWVLVEEFFGAPSDVLVWARDRVRELAGVHPAVRAGFRTVDLVVGDATTYAVGILTGVVAVFGVWSALDLVRVVCMQFVRHVDGARELRRIFPLLPREGIAQGAGGGGADGDVVVDLPPVAAGAAGAGARFERSVDPVDAAERALRGELLSTQAAVLDAKRRALDEEITKLSDIDANLDLSLSSLERERELAGDSPLDRGPDAHRPAFEHADPVVPGARRAAPDPVELPPEKAPAVAAERPGPAPATGGKADGGRVELPGAPSSGDDGVVEYGDLDEVDPGAADAIDRADEDEPAPEDFLGLAGKGHHEGLRYGHRAPRLNVIASNGRTLTGSSSFAHAMSTHSPPRSSNASRVRSVGSMSHRFATPSRA